MKAMRRSRALQLLRQVALLTMSEVTSAKSSLHGHTVPRIADRRVLASASLVIAGMPRNIGAHPSNLGAGAACQHTIEL